MPAKITGADLELRNIRETIIIAIASDEQLMERLVLKGGNALDIVHRLTERSSLDVDFSMSDDFSDQADLDEVGARLFRALRDRFDSIGFVVFDQRIEPRPRNISAFSVTAWGGYNAVFKLIPKETFRSMGGQLGVDPAGELLDQMRRQARTSGPGFQRKFEIEISKFEYTSGRVLKNVGDYSCYVYTPAMIAAEKLRAICQQLPQYQRRANPAPRPRDFFDIHTIAVRADCDLASEVNHNLVRHMFRAKEVPLDFIREIGSSSVYDFHAQEWQSVVNAVRGGAPEPFKFYFDFVVAEGVRLLAELTADGEGGQATSPPGK